MKAGDGSLSLLLTIEFPTRSIAFFLLLKGKGIGREAGDGSLSLTIEIMS